MDLRGLERRQNGLRKLFRKKPRDYRISNQQEVKHYDSNNFTYNIPGVCAVVSRLDGGKITFAEVKEMTKKYGRFLSDIPRID